MEELDTVPIQASWCVGVWAQHDLPRMRGLVVVGDEETGESAEGAEAGKSRARAAAGESQGTRFIPLQYFKEARLTSGYQQILLTKCHCL
jgi:hypothetical protein